MLRLRQPASSFAERQLGEESSKDPLRTSAKRRRTSYDSHDHGLSIDQTPPPRKLRHTDYTIGWICALSAEMAASHAMLDYVHRELPIDRSDTNSYILGSMGTHNVVLTCLPSGNYGTNNAANVASNMMRSFPSIRYGLMVGIGGGVPGTIDIRLGDIVVGETVVQSDCGKIGVDGFQGTGTPRVPPQGLLKAVTKLRALSEATSSLIPSYIEDMKREWPPLAVEYSYPSSSEDRLFRATYEHNGSTDCHSCNPNEVQHRAPREDAYPKVHFGGIASGNQVIKHGRTRDVLAKQLGVICFEMEAAGFVDNFPCLVIRGICDYADSHKNKRWQKYAAATAAAYAKDLIKNAITPNDYADTPVSGSEIDEPELSKAEQDQDEQERAEKKRRDDRRMLLLQSLQFSKIDHRRMAIRTAHAKTCDWLLRSLAYKRWLDTSRTPDHRGFLWISGKPGAGKSTIMKFAFGEAIKTSKDDVATLCYFFQARGEVLERSTFGLFRSLLLQLLERFPDLQEVFDDESLIPLRQISCPTTSILQDLFRNAVMKLGQRRLLCFIDALDECDDAEIVNAVVYFEALAEEALEKQVRLNWCLSSRHYPHIVNRYGTRVVLEAQIGHGLDLRTYVRSWLRLDPGPSSDKIQTQIFRKADGVFLWVVLVVQILNRDFARGHMYKVKQRLREIPNKLGDLFMEILRRNSDGDEDNTDEVLLCIQWLLFAERPLTRKEFYFAMLSGTLEYNDGPMTYDPTEVDNDIMDRLITSSSKGLAEVTNSTEGTVQFIHESVRDFLIKENGFQELYPGLEKNFYALGHDNLKKCCYSVIDVQTTSPVEIPSPNSKLTGKTIKQTLSARYPFLEYAIENVLHHAALAAGGVDQDTFLDQFSLKRWIRFYNVFEGNKICRYTSTATFAYILAEKGLLDLLRTHILHHPDVHQKGQRFGYAFFAALANGHWTAAKTILGPAAVDFHHDEIFPCMDYSKDFDAPKGINTSPLHWALANHHETLIRLLIESKQFNSPTVDQKGRSPMHLAAMVGNENALVMLIKNADKGIGGVVNFTDLYGETPLHMASAHGHESVVKLLVERGAIIDLRGLAGRTPLHRAACSNHDAVARMLIEYGAVINYHGYHSPLHESAIYGTEAVARLLIEHGAVIDAENEAGQTPLHKAAAYGRTRMAKLLLENGATVDSEDVVGKTPIHDAAIYGHDAMVNLLIEEEASTDLSDIHGRTPLQIATDHGHVGIIDILIENGGAQSRTPRGGLDSTAVAPIAEASGSPVQSTSSMLLD